MFTRNIGLISECDQEKISAGSVLVAGVGGMGGVCAEVLVRMGVSNLKIADHDHFEETNFNRQLHSNVETIGKNKAEVLKEAYLKINPSINITAFSEGVTRENVDELLEDVDIVVNGMDKMFYSLILERTARKKKITIVDAWLTPYASVFVMKPDSPHWEDFLDLPTKNIALDDLTEELCHLSVHKEIDYTFSHFSPYEIINREYVLDIAYERKKRPSLGPVVWLSGVMMANEVFKLLTGLTHCDHAGVFIDQYSYQLMPGKIGNETRVNV